MSILELFVSVDEFWQQFEPLWQRELLARDSTRRQRATRLHPSEIMTLIIWFHQSGYRTFKAYYMQEVLAHLGGEFPHLVSYTRFVELMGRMAVPLTVYLSTQRGACTGISFIDSTPLAVCHPARIHQHKVFADVAARGKTSVGWFYGFKLHVIVTDQGDLLAYALTPGNVHDTRPVAHLLRQTTRLFGLLIGDKGYISQPLSDQLAQQYDVRLLTRRRSNMRPVDLDPVDHLLLRKRAIIETIFDQLKNISQIEHTRHRSAVNFVVNLVAGLIAYCHQPKKPALHLYGMLPSVA